MGTLASGGQKTLNLEFSTDIAFSAPSRSFSLSKLFRHLSRGSSPTELKDGTAGEGGENKNPKTVSARMIFQEEKGLPPLSTHRRVFVPLGDEKSNDKINSVYVCVGVGLCSRAAIQLTDSSFASSSSSSSFIIKRAHTTVRPVELTGEQKGN